MRNVKAMETEGPLTEAAVEMDVLVVERAIVVPLTGLITRNARSILDGMHKMLSQEEGEGTEDGGAVYCIEAIVQLAQGQRMAALGQGPIDEQSRGRGFHAAFFEMMSIVFCFHQAGNYR